MGDIEQILQLAGNPFDGRNFLFLVVASTKETTKRTY